MSQAALILQRRIDEKLRSLAETRQAQDNLKVEWNVLQQMIGEDETLLQELRLKLYSISPNGPPMPNALPRHPLEAGVIHTDPASIRAATTAGIAHIRAQMEEPIAPPPPELMPHRTLPPSPDRVAPGRPLLPYGADGTSDQSVLTGHVAIDHSKQDIHGQIKVEGNMAAEEV